MDTSNTNENSPEQPGDHMLRSRLARLGAMPIDTSILDRAMRAQLPQSVHPWLRWVVSASALAASLLIAISVVLAMQGNEAQASGIAMAQMHRDIVSGRVPTMHAESIDDANRAIAAMSGVAGPLQLPHAPAIHTMACCMRDVNHKKVACVLLDHAGTPVTMMVGDIAGAAPQASNVEVREGVEYHYQTVDDLTMVSTQHDQRRICVIGQMSREQLMHLLAGLKF